MPNQADYYIIKKKALPEVFLKVVEVQKLIEKDEGMTIQDAVEKVGISRSSFYKYKDDIFPFYENSRGSIITIGLKIDDEPGLLSVILKRIAEFKANILTIHQAIPTNGVANLTLSVEVLPVTGNVDEMIYVIENLQGCHQVKILAKE